MIIVTIGAIMKTVPDRVMVNTEDGIITTGISEVMTEKVDISHGIPGVPMEDIIIMPRTRMMTTEEKYIVHPDQRHQKK